MAAISAFSTVEKILSGQALTTLIVASGYFLAGGWQMAISPFLGGIAGLLPNLFFAMRVSYAKGKSAKDVLQAFYIGETGKLSITVILFVLIFQLKGIELLPLLSGYVAVLSVFWIALFFARNEDLYSEE